MPRKQIKPTDNVKFSANPDGTYDLYVGARIWAYDVETDGFARTLKRFGVPLPCLVRVEDMTGHVVRQRVTR